MHLWLTLPKNHPTPAHYKTIDLAPVSPQKKLNQPNQIVEIMKVQLFVIIDIDGLDQVILYTMQYIDGSVGSDIFGSDRK